MKIINAYLAKNQQNQTQQTNHHQAGEYGISHIPPSFGTYGSDTNGIVQAMMNDGTGQQPAEVPAASNLTGLPDHMKTNLETMSGFDMSDVRVHYNSPKPAGIGALAYTQGSRIYMGPGQDQHLGHEAWHVVQQKQGRVQANTQFKGVQGNDDQGLEQEADVMGGKANQYSLRHTPSIQDKNKYPVQRISDSVKALPCRNVIQRTGLWDYLKGNLTEDEKDALYFRRSSYNPVNWFSQKQNEDYERTNTAYHSTSVHGAQNTLNNIRNRHLPDPGGARNMSAMHNTMTGVAGTIRTQPNSSRFASSSWEKHVRNDAIVNFNRTAQAVGFSVHWNPNPPAFRAPAAIVHTAMFSINYTNPQFGDYEVGISSARPRGIGATLPASITNVAKISINYEQTGLHNINAWIGQLFPVPNVSSANNNGPVVMANFQGTAWDWSDFRFW